jgi:AraC-like DNA-binding protein
MSYRTIPFHWMQRHTDAAVRNGWSLDDLLAQSLIEPHYGDDRDAIGPVQAVLLCMNTVMAFEDAMLGMARVGLPANYPVIGAMMMLGCESLDAGLQALCRLYGSASSSVQVQLRTEGDLASLSVRIDPAVELDAAYLEEVFLLWIFIQCLHFLGRAPPVFEATLRDPFHFTMDRQHWAIHAPVHYGDLTSFVFPRALLAEPPASRAGPSLMWNCHSRWLDYLNGGLVLAPTEYVNQSGFVQFADMVRESGKSPNTLRRQLRAAQGGFRDCRRHALVDAATNRLRTTDEDVQTIASDLGYSDARSFRRFFKTATGLTPQQVRHQDPTQNTTDDLRVILALKTLSEGMTP